MEEYEFLDQRRRACQLTTFLDHLKSLELKRARRSDICRRLQTTTVKVTRYKIALLRNK